MCVCVRERERERVCVLVYVRVTERYNLFKCLVCHIGEKCLESHGKSIFYTPVEDSALR